MTLTCFKLFILTQKKRNDFLLMKKRKNKQNMSYYFSICTGIHTTDISLNKLWTLLHKIDLNNTAVRHYNDTLCHLQVKRGGNTSTVKGIVQLTNWFFKIFKCVHLKSGARTYKKNYTESICMVVNIIKRNHWSNFITPRQSLWTVTVNSL